MIFKFNYMYHGCSANELQQTCGSQDIKLGSCDSPPTQWQERTFDNISVISIALQ